MVCVLPAPDSLGIPDMLKNLPRLVADRLLSNKTIRDITGLEANGREGFHGDGAPAADLTLQMRHAGTLSDGARSRTRSSSLGTIQERSTPTCSTMFSFDVLMDEFCTSLEGFLPSDCAITESPFVGKKIV